MKSCKGLRSVLKSTVVGGLCSLVLAGAAFAQSRNFDVPAGDLASALDTYIRQSGVQLIYKVDDLKGKTTEGVHGNLPPEEALTKLLANSGLQVGRTANGSIAIGKRPQGEAAASGAVADEPTEVTVTGTRIRGTKVASLVIKRTREQARDEGQNTMGDVIAAIPQNFGGGQNPGVSPAVPEANGYNYGSGNALNLRGLGADATLTLLNGHRMPYSATLQSIDVAAIPLVALDRIEVMPDGASALYGSDAVGGVANVILRKDYNGLLTSARFGGSTDGGNVQQQYDVLGGRIWSSGGFMFAYEFGETSPVYAKDRSYTKTTVPGTIVYPGSIHHSLTFNGHQDLTDRLHASLDVVLNTRRSDQYYPLGAAGYTDYHLYGAGRFYKEDYLSISPEVKLDLPHNWTASARAVYGVDDFHFKTLFFNNYALTQTTDGLYHNTTGALEVGGSGPLFKLPGGDAALAVGIGFTDIGWERNLKGTYPDYVDKSRTNTYAFGELSLPIISPSTNIPFVYRLNFNAAIRHEEYRDQWSVSTPKLGLIYAPSPDIDFQASWGKSFKAPQFWQEYQQSYAYLYKASVFGATSAGSDATVLLLIGGSRSLKPERAENWNIGANFHPRALPGLELGLHYFHVQYQDRVIRPVSTLTQALSNPVYASLVTTSPAASDVSALAAKYEFYNYASTTFDPTKVIAVVNDLNVNATSQMVHGIDVDASYTFALANGANLKILASATNLHVDQTLLPGQPAVEKTGYLYNSPNWKGRAGAIWKSGRLTASAFVNYTGEIIDNRVVASPVTLRSSTTLDTTVRYALSNPAGLLKDVDLDLSVQNLTDAKPPLMTIRSTAEYPYDSTNYSPLGRVVSLSLTKRW